MKKILQYISNPFIFLLLSGLLIISTIKLYDLSNKRESSELDILLEDNISLEDNIIEDIDKLINDEVLKILIQRKNCICIKTRKVNSHVQYEIIYDGISNIYENRNSAIEYWASTLSLEIKNIWKQFGYPDEIVDILMINELDTEQVLFSTENGLVDYSIFDNVKTESSRQDWKDFYVYTYDKEPSEEELNLFIENQKNYGVQ